MDLDWYREGKTFQFGDFPIFYKDEGTGDVILCLHGFPTSSRDWRSIQTALSPQFRVIAPDMLGYGYSAKPGKHNYSLMEQADLYEQLLAHTGVNRFHILAHDIGDNVAQELLARNQTNPQYDIQSICLLNGGIFPEIIRPQAIQQLLLKPVLGAIITRFYNRKIFGKQFSAVFGKNTQPSEAELDAIWSLISRDSGHLIIHKLIHYLREGKIYQERWVGALLKSDLPLKFIVGLDDPVSGQIMLEHLQRQIPEANVTCLEGIGHYPQIEAPEKVLSAYLEFLGK